jgi:hypothetical protein
MQYEKSLGSPQIDKEEHVNVAGVNAKRVVASGYDGSNLQDLHVDSAGDLQVALTNDSIAGTAGTPSADVITVQGITGGTTLPVTEASGSSIKTAVEAVNTALQTGGISQTQFAAMVTALQVIDNNDRTIDLNKVAGESVQVANGTAEKSIRVTVANDSTGQIKLAAGTAEIGKLAAGTANIGDVDIASIAAGSTLIGDVGIGVRTSGGLSLFRSIDLDETEEDVKQTAGQLYGWYMYNAGAAAQYVKFYNATAANVTVGTTTPVLTIPLPAGAAANCVFPLGIAFGTAICVAATTGVADNDTGAPAANSVVVNLYYA